MESWKAKTISNVFTIFVDLIQALTKHMRNLSKPTYMRGFLSQNGTKWPPLKNPPKSKCGKFHTGLCMSSFFIISYIKI